MGALKTQDTFFQGVLGGPPFKNSNNDPQPAAESMIKLKNKYAKIISLNSSIHSKSDADIKSHFLEKLL